MKVSFEIAKETYKIGIFKTIPVHVLYWTTEFNESELSAIERMNIGEELVVGMPTIAYPQTIEENRQRYPKLNGFAPFLLEDLVKCSDGGKRLWRYETELDARQGVADFKRFLVNLKSALERASAPLAESFEL